MEDTKSRDVQRINDLLEICFPTLSPDEFESLEKLIIVLCDRRGLDISTINTIFE